eukprot:UN14825
MAGCYYPDDINDPINPVNDYPHFEKGEIGGIGHYKIDVWDTYLSPKCVEDLGDDLAWKCRSASILYPYIESDLFIYFTKSNMIQNNYFMNSGCHLIFTQSVHCHIMNYYGESFNTSISKVNKKKNDGLFFASCLSHCAGLDFRP